MQIGKIAIVILTGSLSYCTAVFGQTTSYDNAAPPIVIPPSPAAAALFHDIDVPIDYYTGVQKLSIPIYTVKLGALQVPISLHYRANGIKVEEDAGWTGLQWDLDAGGAVGRSIIGFPDEDPNIGYRRTAAYLGMPNPSDFNGINAWFDNFSEDNCNQYTLSLGKTMEMTPDNYFINLCGNSGRLFFDQNDSPYLSPFKPWKISGNEASGYTVVTDDGTTYILQLAENSTNTVETLPSDDHSTPVTGNTSWYLTQIISANGTDTINLSYKAVSYSVPSYIPPETISIPWSNQTSPCGVGTPSGDHTWTYITHSVTGYILSSISTRNQRVDLISNANRSDIPDGSSGMPYKLDSIRVFAIAPGSPDVLLRKWVFNYDYYNKGAAAVTQRLRLLSLIESDPAANLPLQYSFTYHDSTLPAKTSMAQDEWGFYNGKNGNSTMIPTYTDPNGVVTTLADRSVDTTKASLGLLTSIRYPTGGTTSFEYESNRWGKADSLLATASQTAHTAFVGYASPSYDQETFTVPWGQYVTIQTEIHEPTNMAGEGFVQLFAAGSSTPLFTGQTISNLYTTTMWLDAGTYNITATKGDFETQVSALIRVMWQVNTPAPYVGNPVGGARIKRMVQSDGTTTIVKRFTYLLSDSVSSGRSLGTSVYSSLEYVPQICSTDGGNYVAGKWTMYAQHSTSVTALGSVHGGNVAYTKVTVLDGDNGENGWEEYYYNFIDDIGGGGYPYAPPASFDDVRGLLVQKLVFRSDGSLVQNTANTYSVNTDHGDPNFRSIYGVKTGALLRGTTFDANGCPAGLGWEFSSRLYQMDQFWPTLYSTAQTLYSSTGNDSITTTTYFSYDTLNTQVAKKAMLTSKTDSLITYTTFADGVPGNPVCAEMLNRNMLSVPIESDEYRNASFVAKKITNFALFPGGGNQMVLPSTVQLQHAGGILETRLLLNKYDRWGNLSTENKSADAIHTYLYDYQNVYPIAEVVNADSSDVAYTSFEADGTGNWSLSGGTVNNTQAITGTNSYQNGTISKSGLNPATTYIVSYWSQNGAYSIPGTISGYPQQGKTISYHTPAWTLYVHKVTGQSTITVNATGHIDELRLYPSTAQMTTYTYDPLVGMTTQMDAGSRATYYEYDGLQRLKRIRDQDYNILKTIDYAYQAPAGCGSGCYSVAMQTFAGTNTLSYPVGVFDVNGKLLGNATNAAGYVSLWNNDTADARVGTLSQGQDSMHFNITVNAGQTLPASVTGLRYYQVDLPWNVFDGARQFNGAYIDFGDGTGIRMPTNESDTPANHPPNTTYYASLDNDYYGSADYYFVHTYPDTSLKTLTFYHNDAAENSDLDNELSPANSLIRLRNLRGNLPAHTNEIGGSCYQQASMTNLQGVLNWNSISSVQYFRMNLGDGINPFLNVSYPQDFMAGNKGLLNIKIDGCGDTTFKLSRLKSDWTTYFTQLNRIAINDKGWNHEDISVIRNLRSFVLVAAGTPLDSSVIDNVFIQIAAGSGQTESNGLIGILTGGSGRTPASQSAINFLLSKGWTIAIDGVYITSN
jgi:hypothetical protein